MKQAQVVSCVNLHACTCYNNVKLLCTLILKQGYSNKKLLPLLGVVDPSYLMCQQGFSLWVHSSGYSFLSGWDSLSYCHGRRLHPSAWGSTPSHPSPPHHCSPSPRAHILLPLLAHKVTLLPPPLTVDVGFYCYCPCVIIV